jgi:hypothetical protein
MGSSGSEDRTPCARLVQECNLWSIYAAMRAHEKTNRGHIFRCERGNFREVVYL